MKKLLIMMMAILAACSMLLAGCGGGEKKAATEMLKVTLVKSGSGRLVKQMRTLEALGLRKTNSYNIVPDNAATRGMIFVVKHLVSVEKVK